MAAPLVIECRALDHAFGTGEARAQVLFGVDLAVRRGEFVVLKGASGSGKTTLLTLLACLREIQTGTVEVLGNRLDGARAGRLVEVRRRLGFIFQSHNLHPALSAMQNVRMGLELHGGPAMGNWQDAAAHVLTSLGLGARLDYLPAKLSGGQKQRVAVARALVGNPDIVFADEPTAALDAESGRKVVDILKKLGHRRGTTSLVVTHDQRVLDCADRIVTLDGGRIVDDVRRP
jgi:putative ABC transport system ATP-binding protein